jgi:drug/metabolite transporter (DMT)-like permease
LLHSTGETFRPSDILGVLFAIVGAVIVVMSSKDSQIVLGPDALKAALLQASFLVYAGAV